MSSHEKPPEGFNLCFAQQCTACEGTGWVKPRYCAANDVGYSPFYQEKMLGSGAVPPPIPCAECLKGFRFASLNLNQLLPYLLKQLSEDKKLQQALLDVVVDASEGRIIDGREKKP
jgi:hypothetical protein